MEQKLIHQELQIEGMNCNSCEMRIENALKKLAGIIEVKAVFSSSIINIIFDANIIKLDKIIETIEKLNYKVKSKQAGSGIKINMDRKASEDKFSINRCWG
jgi:copper chaperone CopZ